MRTPSLRPHTIAPVPVVYSLQVQALNSTGVLRTPAFVLVQVTIEQGEYNATKGLIIEKEYSST